MADVNGLQILRYITLSGISDPVCCKSWVGKNNSSLLPLHALHHETHRRFTRVLVSGSPDMAYRRNWMDPSSPSRWVGISFEHEPT